jgi:glycosyltransferase involved in cell wall biosynthesis
MSYAVVTMVKNEEAVLPRCLGQFPNTVRKLVVDTGSTDKTKDVAWEMNADVVETEWEGFGPTRTKVMQIAREKLDEDWLVLTDADAEIEGEITAPAVDMGHVNFHYDDLVYRKPQIVKRDLPWYFKGAIHEYMTCDAPHTIGNVDSWVMYHRGDGGARRSPDDDLKILHAEYVRDPRDPRTVFYLGQTYKDKHIGEGGIQNARSAIRWYQKRTTMGDWDEEIWYSAWQSGRLMTLIDRAEAIEELLRATELRPHRAETYHTLSWVLREGGQYHMAARFAEIAMKLPVPNDVIMIHHDVYDHLAQYEFILSAMWAGRTKEAEETAEKLFAKASAPQWVRDTVRENFARVGATDAADRP